MNWTDDELMAYADGELAGQHRAALAEALLGDADLRGRVTGLQTQRRRLSAAFAGVPALKLTSPVTCPAIRVALNATRTPAISPATNAILLFMDISLKGMSSWALLAPPSAPVTLVPEHRVPVVRWRGSAAARPAASAAAGG